MSNRGRLCLCPVHCPESPYHEKACCEAVFCDCFCHVGQRSPTTEIFRARYLKDRSAAIGPKGGHPSTHAAGRLVH